MCNIKDLIDKLYLLMRCHSDIIKKVNKIVTNIDIHIIDCLREV